MSRAGRLLLPTLLLALGLPSESSAESEPARSAPSIVLISIDTLRSDRLPLYGYRGVETPAIDALASGAIVLDRAYSHSPLTLPSHASIFTGRLPADHGVRDNQGYTLDAAATGFLPLELQKRGYATGAAVSAFVLRSETGFGLGFDTYEDNIERQGKTVLGGVSRSGAETLAAIEPWLSEVAGRPFFLFFHLFEPHTPYEAPEVSGHPYDDEIAAADRVVGQLVERLKSLGVYEHSWIVLLSDHGEGLGDHGELEHGLLLYREALQVPLVIKPPAGGAPRRVEEPVQLIDVYPTILEIAGAPVPEDLAGTSLLTPTRPENPPRIVAETLYPRLRFGWSDLASVIEGDYHFIDGPDPELYDLESDPGETRNLIREQRRLAGDLHRHLAGSRRAVKAPEQVDEATREKLAALGYLGATVEAADGPLPDPKAQLETLRDLRRAAGHTTRGELDEAAALYRQILNAHPRMLDGWQALGNALRRLGRLEESLEATTRAFEISGGDPELALGLARGYQSLSLRHLERRSWAAARDAARRAVDLEPGLAAAWNQLGVALYHLKQPDAALEAWQRSVEIDPHSLDTLYNLGTRAAELGRRDLARRALRSFLDQASPEANSDDLRRARVLLRRLES